MSILRYLAAPLAPLYGAVVRFRNRSFDAHPERAATVPVPVISVGNLSAGGTGKTPLTLFLAEGLEAAGWTNAVLSRGYGGRRDIDPMSVEADSDPRQTGDEPLLMARRLGPHRVVVGRKRHAAALRALSQRPETRCLLLDDGFQHRALHRDLDLLVLDGVRLWGDGRLLPLGDLREPETSAGRAHALVVTRAGRTKNRAAVETWWARHGSGGPFSGWISGLAPCAPGAAPDRNAQNTKASAARPSPGAASGTRKPSMRTSCWPATVGWAPTATATTGDPPRRSCAASRPPPAPKEPPGSSARKRMR